MSRTNERTLFFLDSALEVIEICDEVISFEYSGRFCGAGELSCEIAASDGFVPPEDGYVMCGEGFVYAVDRVTKKRGSTEVHGRGILSMLSRRTVPRDIAANTSPEAFICTLLADHGEAAFPLPLDVVCPEYGQARQIAIEAGDLLERIVFLASSVSKGLQMEFSPTTRRFRLSIISGTDRRLSNEAGNEPAFLSELSGSVADLTQTCDRSRYINRVTVRGAETAEGETYTVTADAADFGFSDGIDDSAEAVREKYVKSGLGVSLYTSSAGGVRVFDSAGYLAALRERARQELALHRIRSTLSAQLVGEAAESIGVGDLCTLYSASSGAKTVKVTSRTVRFRDGELSFIAELASM